MPFFSSLIFTGTRVGGQRERQTQAFESSAAYFPRDYPCTGSYGEYAYARALEEQDTWERKPPAKRPNYERLGTRSPFRPDWEIVLGLRDPGTDADASTLPGEFVSAQRENDMDVDAVSGASPGPEEPAQQTQQTAVDTEDVEGPLVEPWLLRGPETRAVLEAAANRLSQPFGLFEQLARLREKRGLAPLALRPDDVWRHALVRVRLRMCGRGCPEDLAMLYDMDDAEAAKWVRATQARKKSVGVGAEQEVEDETEVGAVLCLL